MYPINLFRNVKTPQNPQIISIETYVNHIQNGFSQSDVLRARVYGKGSPLYDRIKENQPCVTLNFLFEGQKSDATIASPTGLLYFDIDDTSKLPALDNSKIYIQHASFGGLGKSIIVQASGITKENFKDSYKSIASELGIADCMDINAIKKTQYTVLSYDPNIIFNPNSFVFTATENPSFSSNMYPSQNLTLNDRKITPEQPRIPFRMTNASDFVNPNEDYQVFPEGLETAKIILPKNTPKGMRTKKLMAITHQYVALNPQKDFDSIFQMISGVNVYFTNEPLTEKEVYGIVKSIFKYKEDGTLKPINNKVRKVVFSDKCKLSKEEKVTIVNKEVGKMRVECTKQKIHDAIVNWNHSEKITSERIAIEIGMGIATVGRYWPEFKELAIKVNFSRNIKQ